MPKWGWVVIIDGKKHYEFSDPEMPDDEDLQLEWESYDEARAACFELLKGLPSGIPWQIINQWTGYAEAEGVTI